MLLVAWCLCLYYLIFGVLRGSLQRAICGKSAWTVLSCRGEWVFRHIMLSYSVLTG